jgi:hypothetical protein
MIENLFKRKEIEEEHKRKLKEKREMRKTLLNQGITSEIAIESSYSKPSKGKSGQNRGGSKGVNNAKRRKDSSQSDSLEVSKKEGMSEINNEDSSSVEPKDSSNSKSKVA